MALKVVQALKELRIIEKKTNHNNVEITRLASGTSIEKPIMGSEREQMTEVTSLLQANTDLFNRYLDLKTGLEKTNLATIVTIGGVTKTVSEWLVIRRKLGKMQTESLMALNDKEGQHRLRGQDRPGELSVQIVRYYDEKDRMRNLAAHRDRIESIDGTLEVVNATTDVIGF